MIRLQCAVHSWDSAVAAVQAGADELLLRSWEGTVGQAMSDTVSYCRRRGVLTILDLTGRADDRQLEKSSGLLSRLYAQGLDAALASDAGVLRMVKMTAPDALLHYCGYIHNSGGVRHAAENGCSRAVLAPGLSIEAMHYICRAATIEVQVPVYGRMCPAVGGAPCFLGEGPGCSLSCMSMYGYDGKADETPLSPALLDITAELPRLEKAGVAAAFYSGENDVICPANGVLSERTRAGAPGIPSFSGAYDTLSRSMPPSPGGELQRVPVRFYCLLERGEPARLAISDEQGRTEVVSGPPPVFSANQLLEAEVNTQLYKTAGSPYHCVEARTRLKSGLNISLEQLRDMRRRAIAKLDNARQSPPERDRGRYYSGVKLLPRRESPQITLQLASMRQLSGDLIKLGPACIYLPLRELAQDTEKTEALCGLDIDIAAIMPRIMGDADAEETRLLLKEVYSAGVTQALVHHPGHLELVMAAGFKPRGEFYCSNSQALKEYKQAGLLSVLLSPFMSLAALKDLSHGMDTEILLYGRIPMLLSGRCLIKPHYGICRCDSTVELTDVKGRRIPIVREQPHMSLVYHHSKLWMEPYRSLWDKIGLWAGRLSFTTENNREVLQVAERFLSEGKYVPNQTTTGFYQPERMLEK